MATMKKKKKDPVKGPVKSGMAKSAEKKFPAIFEPVTRAGKAISKLPMKPQGPGPNAMSKKAEGIATKVAAPLIRAGKAIKDRMRPAPPTKAKRK
jgi:hypothetical protein